MLRGNGLLALYLIRTSDRAVQRDSVLQSLKQGFAVYPGLETPCYKKMEELLASNAHMGFQMWQLQWVGRIRWDV